MIQAILKELVMRKSYLNNEIVETIYFGGGTPSVLDASEISEILNVSKHLFNLSSGSEITLEANPDDLSQEKLVELYQSGINRLSIGIQSFDNTQLKYLNRAHNSQEAVNCVQYAKSIGFDNISVDLIYGIPFEQQDPWKENIDKALALDINHISAYCLTIEPDTVFGNWVQKKKINPVDEDLATDHFNLLLETMESNDFEQYEISNFSRPGQYSRHNSSYWHQKKYLGIGPSAHSYDSHSRQFNISNNAKYISSIASDKIPAQIEILSDTQKANELMMTGLRTKWGVSLKQLEGYLSNWSDLNETTINDYISKEMLIKTEGYLKITKGGKLLADQIALDLFVE